MFERDENHESESGGGTFKKEAFDAITQALKDKDEVNLLFMCSANICRSPYAEMRFEQLWSESSCSKVIHVASGGITTSYAIHPFTRQGLLDVGVAPGRIDRFSPRNMRKHKDELESADIILVPSREVISMMPRKYLVKTFLFSEAVSGNNVDIDDPVLLKEYKPYKIILDQLDGYLVDIVRVLQETWVC